MDPLPPFAIMHDKDLPRDAKLHNMHIDRNCRNGLAMLASAVLLAFAAVPAGGQSSGPPTPCDPEAYLATELFGSINIAIDWKASVLTCEGMPRPAGEGARLRLAGPLTQDGHSRRIAFIIAIPGLRQGDTGKDMPTNVTLMEEGTGRFFSTADTAGCFTDVQRQERIGEENAADYRITGTVWCVSPLAELNGVASVSFTELGFSGRVEWEQ